MYVILIYDVAEKRVSKMLKLCRQYLCWIQNSVFEGELSEVKLRELQNKIHSLIDKKEDIRGIKRNVTKWKMIENDYIR